MITKFKNNYIKFNLIFIFYIFPTILKITKVIYLFYFILIFIQGVITSFILISPILFDILNCIYEILLPISYCIEEVEINNNRHEIIHLHEVNIINLFNALPRYALNEMSIVNYTEITQDELNTFNQRWEIDNTLAKLEIHLNKRFENSKMVNCLSINNIRGFNFNELRTNEVNTLIKNISSESNFIYLNSLAMMKTFFLFERENDWKLEFSDLLNDIFLSNKEILYLHNIALNKIIYSYNIYQTDIINSQKEELSRASTLTPDLLNYIFDNYLNIQNSFLLKYLNIHKNLFVFLKTFNLNIEKQINFVANHINNERMDLYSITHNINFSKYSNIYFKLENDSINFENTIDNFFFNFPDLLNNNIFENNQRDIDFLKSLQFLNCQEYVKALILDNQNLDNEYTTLNFRSRNLFEEQWTHFMHFRTFFLQKNLINQNFNNLYYSPNNNFNEIIENSGFLINNSNLEQNNNPPIRNIRPRLNL